MMWMCQGSGSEAFASPRGVGVPGGRATRCGARRVDAPRTCSVEWLNRGGLWVVIHVCRKGMCRPPRALNSLQVGPSLSVTAGAPW